MEDIPNVRRHNMSIVHKCWCLLIGVCVRGVGVGVGVDVGVGTRGQCERTLQEDDNAREHCENPRARKWKRMTMQEDDSARM